MSLGFGYGNLDNHGCPAQRVDVWTHDRAFPLVTFQAISEIKKGDKIVCESLGISRGKSCASAVGRESVDEFADDTGLDAFDAFGF